jgi:hypothetical protein
MLTSTRTKRLLVSRQDGESRRFGRIGVLACKGDEYTFTYEAGVTRALPGLPLGRVHTSPVLFPIFAERVMHPMRPDRPEALARLGLTPDAGPFEVLSISGGGRTGDTYELTPLPETGPVELPFLVHGIRHLSTDEQARIDLLAVDQELQLVDEPDNIANERALLVTDDGSKLGYVPDPLLDYVHNIVQRDHSLTVARVNPADAGLHLRLLVVLRGSYIG